MRALVISLILSLTLVSTVNAAPPAKPFITVIETSFESPGWARYPIDSIYGTGVWLRYRGSDWARFTCHNEAGALVWESGPRWITGEGGELSVGIDYTAAEFPYVAASYNFCVAELLDKRLRKVIAKDDFIIYSPV